MRYAGPPAIAYGVATDALTLDGALAAYVAPDGRHDLAEVRDQADERPAGRAERVGDRHLGVAVALGQQVEGEHLGVVEVVDDLGVGGRRRATAPGSRTGRR